MKKLLFITLLLITGCGQPAIKDSDPEHPSKFKKGDIVCVIEFHVKGIVQYEVTSFHSDEPVYDVMFMDKHDQLYDLHIYESQLEQCP